MARLAAVPRLNPVGNPFLGMGGGFSAKANLLRQEQARVARNTRMGRLAARAGFVENGPEGRATARPEQCRQSFRPGGCQRGAAFRYAHNDLELRTLEALTRQGGKFARRACAQAE